MSVINSNENSYIQTETSKIHESQTDIGFSPASASGNTVAKDKEAYRPEEVKFAIKRAVEHYYEDGGNVPEKLKRYFPDMLGGYGNDSFFPVFDNGGLTNDEAKSKAVENFVRNKDDIKFFINAIALGYLTEKFSNEEEIRSFVDKAVQERSAADINGLVSEFYKNKGLEAKPYMDFLYSLNDKIDDLYDEYIKTAGEKERIIRETFEKELKEQMNGIFGTSSLTLDAVEDLNSFLNEFPDSTQSVNQILYQIKSHPENFSSRVKNLANSVINLKKSGVRENLFDEPVWTVKQELMPLNALITFRDAKKAAAEHSYKLFEKIINETGAEANDLILAFTDIEKDIDYGVKNELNKKALKAVEEYLKENGIDVKAYSVINEMKNVLKAQKDVLKRELTFNDEEKELNINPFNFSSMSNKESFSQDLLKDALEISLTKNFAPDRSTVSKIYSPENLKELADKTFEKRKYNIDDIVDLMNIYNTFVLVEQKKVNKDDLNKLIDSPVISQNSMLKENDKEILRSVINEIEKHKEQINLKNIYPDFSKQEIRERVVTNFFLKEDADLKEKIAKNSGLYRFFGMSNALKNFSICSEKAQNPVTSFETTASMLRDCFDKLKTDFEQEAKEAEDLAQNAVSNPMGALNPFVFSLFVSAVVKRQFSENMEKNVYETIKKANETAEFIYDAKDLKDRTARETVTNLDAIDIDYNLVKAGYEDEYIKEVKSKKILLDIKDAIENDIEIQQTAFLRHKDKIKEIEEQNSSVKSFLSVAKQSEEEIKKLQEVKRVFEDTYNTLYNTYYDKTLTPIQKRNVINQAKNTLKEYGFDLKSDRLTDLLNEMYKQYETGLLNIGNENRPSLSELLKKEPEDLNYGETMALFEAHKELLKEIDNEILNGIKNNSDVSYLLKDRNELVNNMKVLKLNLITNEDFLKRELIKETKRLDPHLHFDESRNFKTLLNEIGAKTNNGILKKRLQSFTDAITSDNVEGQSYNYLNNFLVANEEILKNSDMFEEITDDADLKFFVRNAANGSKEVTFAKGLSGNILEKVYDAEKRGDIEQLGEYQTLSQKAGIAQVSKTFVKMVSETYENARTKHQVLKEAQTQQYRNKRYNPGLKL